MTILHPSTAMVATLQSAIGAYLLSFERKRKLRPGVTIAVSRVCLAVEEVDLLVHDKRASFELSLVGHSQYPIRVPLGEFLVASIRATYPDDVAELLNAPEPPSK